MRTHQGSRAKSGVGGGAAAWELPGQGTRGTRRAQGLGQLPRQNPGLWEDEVTRTTCRALPCG